MSKLFNQIFIYSLLILPAVIMGQTQSTSPDTTLQKGVQRTSDLEGPVEYEARIFDNDILKRKTVLIGSAVVKYLDISLRAARITVDWETNLMVAEGVLDSVWTVDAESGDSIRVEELTGLPEFTEAGDLMTGERMVYNFKTRKGRVLRGRTTFEEAFYSGKVMKMVGKKTAFIGDAILTTCDHKDNPHFHFRAKKMRIDMKKSVVARPIVLCIGKIPVLALPFVYFPIKKGRRSGVLLPKYGQSSLEGNYLKGFGYYWAASQYWDVQGTMDYYEKSGFLFRGDLKYNIRYKMQGGISGSWTRKNFKSSGETMRRWDLVLRHSQTISPTLRFSANGTFVSSKDIYRQLSANRNQRMQSQIISNATITKRWQGSKSMTINLNRTQNLRTDEFSETLPRISFRGGRSAIFKKPETQKGEIAESHWYNNIYISYDSKLEARRKKTLLVNNNTDTTFSITKKMGWDHNLRLNSPQKIMKWITFSPNVNYKESWTHERTSHYWNADSARKEEEIEQGFFARRTYDMSLSLGTKLYGIFRTKYLPDVMVRHVVTPSMSFTFQPDFSAASFDYYDAVKDTSGKITYYDRYGKSMLSSTPRGGRKSLNFNVSNLFQMKAGEGENEKKIDLFSWNVSTGYNWNAEKFKLGNITSSLRAKPLKNLGFNMNATHSLYQTDETGRTIDRFYFKDVDWSDKNSIFDSRYIRLVNFSADVRMTFKGSTGGKSKKTETTETSENKSELQGVKGNTTSDRFDVNDDIGNFNMPWNLTTSLRYSDSRYNPKSPSKNFWLNADLKFNLTKNWKISWVSRIDLLDRQMVSQDIVIQRDLHCWEARFVWSPIGLYKRFYLRINIKSSMLQDIKFEKGTGRRGFSGSSFQNSFY